MISVTSEIGPLKSVLLHRPGRELERLTPKYLEEMLFEDIPWLKKIRQEHDLFADTLRSHGCEVLYYHDLLVDVLREMEIRREIVAEILSDCRIGSLRLKEVIKEFLQELSPESLSGVIIAGLAKSEIDNLGGEKRLALYLKEAYPFYINPLTNLYFTRDPGAVIGSGLALNAMKTPARMREALILKYLHRHHPLFGETVPLWYTPEDLDSIEGGDILVLSPQTVAVGCSARTGAEGIERLAKRLLFSDSGVREVLVIQIPFTRAFMHLDTVLTMVDRDTFTIFPGIRDEISLFRITPAKEKAVTIKALDTLEHSLENSLGISDVRLIESGGGDALTAAREQWNDSTNTLALAPGVVVTYDRNVASNDALREAGIEVVEIEGSELVRGRGGPRCMSMPLHREAL
jgi:arginine deiminase